MINFLSANILDSLVDFVGQMGFTVGDWGNYVMIAVSFLLMYLAIVKKYEPMLMLTIAFGMLLTNLPGANMFHSELFADDAPWLPLGQSNSASSAECNLTSLLCNFKILKMLNNSPCSLRLLSLTFAAAYCSLIAENIADNFSLGSLVVIIVAVFYKGLSAIRA